ncbi:endonuclease/exonuclease/phosphatase family protein [Candidatus Saccharibacteria bacterium]|nr:endonuclease/exonuclease/phosphatase family protein [Candidatus Saccharibacteria bacterium]
MKVLQLNVWLGKVEGKLQRFLENADYDVICMQEVVFAKKRGRRYTWGIFTDLEQILEATKMPYAYYAPNWSNRIGHGRFKVGNLILSKVPFESVRSKFVTGSYLQIATKKGRFKHNNLNVIIAKLENGITIATHHGFWRPQPLGDEESVKAFNRLAKIIKPYAESGPFVLCGDLNLVHKAPAMRALDFMHDLTYENKVNNTLSGLKINKEIACDHIYVNDQIIYSDFKIEPEVVSDHFGLSVDVEKK